MRCFVMQMLPKHQQSLIRAPPPTTRLTSFSSLSLSRLTRKEQRHPQQPLQQHSPLLSTPVPPSSSPRERSLAGTAELEPFVSELESYESEAELHEESAPVLMINPVMLATSRARWEEREGCLSIPGYSASIARPFAIHASFWTREGEAAYAILRGWDARVFQHELDHLNGKLFIDYLSPTSLGDLAADESLLQEQLQQMHIQKVLP